MVEPAWLNAHQQRVWRQWLRVNALLPAVLHRSLQRQANLSLPDFEVLVLLTEAPDGRLRITELSRALQWEKSRLSHHLSRMCARGLTCRQSCPDDARGAFICLTDQGRKAIQQAAPGHVAVVREAFFDELSSEDVAFLDDLTSRLMSRIEGLARSEGTSSGP